MGKAASVSSPSEQNRRLRILRASALPFSCKGGVCFTFRVRSNISCPLRFLIFPVHGRSALAFHTFSKAGPNPLSISILSETTTQNELCQYLHLPSLFPMQSSHFGTRSIGESLSLVPPTLVAPRVGRRILLHLFQCRGTPFSWYRRHKHTPYTSLSILSLSHISTT